MFYGLFQSPYCNFLVASDALLLVHNSPNTLPDFFPFIVYLQPLPLMDSIVYTGCDMRSLISRHLNITFSPVECPLQPSYPMMCMTVTRCYAGNISSPVHEKEPRRLHPCYNS